MTDRERPEGDDDLSAAPEYEQLGEQGNPFSGNGDGDTRGESLAGGHADVDSVPNQQGAGTGEPEDGQNAPLPDSGPTDGGHGVDGETSTT